MKLAYLAASQQERLGAFVELLLTWNRRINLISRGDETRIWERHIGDSLQIAPFIPPLIDRAIDLGSVPDFLD